MSHYRGVCKNIETGQKKYNEIASEQNEIQEDLKTLQKSEMENTDLQPEFFNYNVTQKTPLLFTVEDFKKGLENKRGEFFRNMDEIDENEKKIQIVIKIRKYVLDE